MMCECVSNSVQDRPTLATLLVQVQCCHTWQKSPKPCEVQKKIRRRGSFFTQHKSCKILTSAIKVVET